MDDLIHFYNGRKLAIHSTNTREIIDVFIHPRDVKDFAQTLKEYGYIYTSDFYKYSHAYYNLTDTIFRLSVRLYIR